MAVTGIWTVDYYGAFGWENAGVLVLEKGRAVGGGNNHFSIGTYESSGQSITIELTLEYIGTPRTLFGEKQRRFDIELHGRHTLKSMEGTVNRPDKKVIPLQFRMIRRAPL